MHERPVIFIQSNDKQLIGARIAAYSFRRNSRFAGGFDVRIMEVHDFPRLKQRGRTYVRDGALLEWDVEDLQSFTPLRFAPPGLMGFTGRALVTDPDCFAVAGICGLLDRDMEGKAICAVRQPWHGEKKPHWASSVMLLDCSKLKHWNFDSMLDGLFDHRFDYRSWNRLELEDQSTVGDLEPVWNDYDALTEQTKILHTTRRRTQPWKTGLPIDYTGKRALLGWLRQPRYLRHPDRCQEAYVYSLLAEMIDVGEVTIAELRTEMAHDHLRHDSLELIEMYRGWEWVTPAAADWLPARALAGARSTGRSSSRQHWPHSQGPAQLQPQPHRAPMIGAQS